LKDCIYPRPPFNFDLILQSILNMNKDFSLYIDKRNHFCIKAIRVNQRTLPILIKWNCSIEYPKLIIENLSDGQFVSREESELIVNIIKHIFDLDYDIKNFYDFCSYKKIDFTSYFYGMRINKSSSLYEGGVKTILSQQVNMKYASKLIKLFTERFGDKITFIYNEEAINLFSFPEQTITEIEDLKFLPISSRKMHYILNIGVFCNNINCYVWDYPSAQYSTLRENILSVKGIGEWSANYILMFTFGDYNLSLPTDAGLKKALSNIFKKKETLLKEEIEFYLNNWDPFKTYITFYCWEYDLLTAN
jgi:DNA-3-methyladenine glycosylase II